MIWGDICRSNIEVIKLLISWEGKVFVMTLGTRLDVVVKVFLRVP